MCLSPIVRPASFCNSSLIRSQGATYVLSDGQRHLPCSTTHVTGRRAGVVRVAADLVGRAWRGADRQASLSPSVSRGWPRLACDTPAAPHTHPNVAKIAKPTRIASDTFKVVEVGGEKTLVIIDL